MIDVNLELRQLSRMIERKEREGTMPTFEGDKLIGFSRFIEQYNEAFFELYRLAQIACTIYQSHLFNQNAHSVVSN